MIMSPNKPMTFYEAVALRHSVREYKPDAIPEDALMRILEAARLSPSGGNNQEWAVVVAQDAALRGELAQAAGDQSWIAQAPVVICWCSKPHLPVGNDGSTEDSDDFSRTVNILRWGKPAVQMMERFPDRNLLALLMGNGGTMIAGTHTALAAAAEGLGTCWIGYLDVERASRSLKLPDEWKCYFLMPMGYPAQVQHIGGHNRKPLTEFLHWDEWGCSR